MKTPKRTLLAYSEDLEAVLAGRPWFLCPKNIAPKPGEAITIRDGIGRTRAIDATVTNVSQPRGINQDWCIVELTHPTASPE